ncbi:hypothetical protein N9100_02140 [Gammaproteobacteria bacterium]|nr:hypothetical protein [Gammaproteobacteria bacterium]
MNYDKKRLCILKACDAKLVIARSELADIVSFKNSPFDILGDVRWHKTTSGKALQVVGVLILIPLLLIWTVLTYIIGLIVISQKIMVLWLKTIMPGLLLKLTDESEERSLHTLWDNYGLDRYESSADNRLALLECWLRILYGAGAEELQLKDRVNAISQRHIESNQSYYEGTGGPHYNFLPPVDSLIRELSSELPQYEKWV